MDYYNNNNELLFILIILVIAVRMGWRWFSLFSISRNKEHPEHKEKYKEWPDFNGPIVVSIILCTGLCFQFNLWYFLEYDYFTLPLWLNISVLATTNLITILVVSFLANQAHDITNWLYDLLRGGWVGKQLRNWFKKKEDNEEKEGIE